MVSSLIQIQEPVSRTDQYKRVMKPLLERKRRARINRCLDELRDLLVSAMQAEGETVTRLEKADILELTVKHVRKLNQRRRFTTQNSTNKLPDRRDDAMKFQQGFLAAAQQVQTFLLSTPTLVEPSASSRLLVHLSSCASAISEPAAQSVSTTVNTPQIQSPAAPVPINITFTSSCSTSNSTISVPAICHRQPQLASIQHSSKYHPKTSTDISDLTYRATNTPKLVIPTPIRKEPVIVLKESNSISAPQDLSIKRFVNRSPNQIENDAWRPW